MFSCMFFFVLFFYNFNRYQIIYKKKLLLIRLRVLVFMQALHVHVASSGLSGFLPPLTSCLSPCPPSPLPLPRCPPLYPPCPSPCPSPSLPCPSLSPSLPLPLFLSPPLSVSPCPSLSPPAFLPPLSLHLFRDVLFLFFLDDFIWFALYYSEM